MIDMKNRCDQYLVEIEGLLSENRFVLASELAEKVLQNCEGLAGYRKAALYAQLFAYNRMHWLVEGRVVADCLARNQTLLGQDWFEIALFFVLSGQPKQARQFFKKSLTGTVNKYLVYSEIAITYEQQGFKEKALPLYQQLIDRALKRKLLADSDVRVFARKSGLVGLSKREYKFLGKIVTESSDERLTASIAFVLAASSRRARAIEKEIEWLEVANNSAEKENKRIDLFWDLAIETKNNDKLVSLFDVRKPKWMPGLELAQRTEQFIFVLGMPRSGTTLLEQILGAHPDIGNCGESRAMGISLYKAMSMLGHKRLSHSRQVFEEVQKFELEHYSAIANYYCAYQDQLSQKKIRTDKELANINNVGIAANLFPRAKFIFIERNPLDNCASLMQQDFGGAAYATNPVNSILEHREYRRRADHWKRTFPDRFLSIRYEGLVEDFEDTLKRLVDFLGVEWRDELLTFYERNNSVRTPSISQVRSPINGASVGKWESYRTLLGDAENIVRQS